MVGTCVVILIAFLIYHYSTGWTETPVSEYNVVRIATTYTTAEYSETEYDVSDGTYDTSYWSEPASDVGTLIKVNGDIQGEGRAVIKHKGDEYIPFGPVHEVDQNKFDRFDKNYDEKFYVEAEFGKDKCGHSKYHKFVQHFLTGKPCVADFHHGKFWGYSLPK